MLYIKMILIDKSLTLYDDNKEYRKYNFDQYLSIRLKNSNEIWISNVSIYTSVKKKALKDYVFAIHPH